MSAILLKLCGFCLTIQSMVLASISDCLHENGTYTHDAGSMMNVTGVIVDNRQYTGEFVSAGLTLSAKLFLKFF